MKNERFFDIIEATIVGACIAYILLLFTADFSVDYTDRCTITVPTMSVENLETGETLENGWLTLDVFCDSVTSR